MKKGSLLGIRGQYWLNSRRNSSRTPFVACVSMCSAIAAIWIHYLPNDKQTNSERAESSGRTPLKSQVFEFTNLNPLPGPDRDVPTQPRHTRAKIRQSGLQVHDSA